MLSIIINILIKFNKKISKIIAYAKILEILEIFFFYVERNFVYAGIPITGEFKKIVNFSTSPSATLGFLALTI